MYRERDRAGVGSKTEIGGPFDRKRINDALDKHLEKSSPSTSKGFNNRDNNRDRLHVPSSKNKLSEDYILYIMLSPLPMIFMGPVTSLASCERGLLGIEIRYFVSMRGHRLGYEDAFAFSGVYGPNEDILRQDLWDELEGETPVLCRLDRFLVNDNHEYSMQEVMNLDHTCISWNLGFHRNLNDWEMDIVTSLLEKLISFHHHPGEDDKMTWVECAKGLSSVKTFYKALNNPTHITPLSFPKKKVWVPRLPS
ncbi:hypothetical protein GIB67_015330 [Kingdonia uniflora]|uniref:Uncharacterized protein n=1 Tax=Kingdonia uniflora TaxID=39325 RepID=A0A7J7KYR3_9MAGN|nr:hypothetical protein GIB67_015330 [Kingdonia uniflora]